MTERGIGPDPVLAQLRHRIDAPRRARLVDWIADLAGPGGFVAELGCGDGVLLSGLKAHGIMGAGVDPSDALTAQARARGVSAKTGVLGRAMVPPASLICALAESLAVGPDAETAATPLAALLPRLAQGLRPGGALLLELPGPGVPTGEMWQEGDGWALYQTVSRSGAQVTRDVVGFLAEADGTTWRRGADVQHLTLSQPAQVAAILGNVGLHAEVLERLGPVAPLPGCFAVLGRKP